MNGWVAVFLFTEKGKNGKLATFFYFRYLQ